MHEEFGTKSESGESGNGLIRLAYTVAEFAALFGRSQAWGYRRIYAGEVVALEIGGRAMITREEILRFMSTRKEFPGRPTKAG
ncbi:MAG: helix-turn-helix domain-containing protein [Verrucomicrobiae bacterium]|nr:helix-turn-helix domain-containing protein [Verrucomicrobiae bacterium]